MAVYYISAILDGQQVLYAMNATANISNNQSGSLSSHKLEDGNQASDNYRNNPQTISMTGVISDVFVGNKVSTEARKSTKDYIEGLEKIKNNSVPFTVHYSSDLTPRFPCYFLDLTLIQDNEHGYVGEDLEGKSVNCYTVAMNIQVARIGQSARIVSGAATDFVNKVSPNSGSSRSTSQLEEEQETLYQEGLRLTLEANETFRQATTIGDN